MKKSRAGQKLMSYLLTVVAICVGVWLAYTVAGQSSAVP
jgi:hypothetical protein